MRSLRFLYWLCVFLFTSGFLGFCSPMAIIKADKQSGTAPLTVQFDASRSFCFTSAIVGYQWDFDSNGTIDAEGISTTYIYSTPGAFTAKLIVRDAKNHESIATTLITATTPISLSIISPTPGEDIAKPSVMVKGTFANPTGNETGITLNGITAAVSGNSFIIDNVPVPEGDVTLTVKAVDTQGYTAESSVAVHVAIAEKYLKLESDPDMGVTPLEARLKLSGSFNYLTPELTYSGPSGGQVEVLEQRVNDYRVRMTGPGVYNFSISAKDDQGEDYIDTVAITVMDKEVLGATLNAKWEGLQNALLQNDVEAAVKDFSDVTKEGYRNTITALSDEQRTQLANAIGNAHFIGLKCDIAEYDLRMVIDGKEFSFYLVFQKDANGIWKIRSF